MTRNFHSDGSKRIRRAALASLLVASTVATAPIALSAQDAGAGYDEAVSGDISNDGANPLALALGNGSNVLSGSVVGGPSADLDYVNVTVPEGHVLAAADLVSYESGNDVSFIGIQSGSVFTELPQSANPGNLLGFTLFGPQVGSDILPAIGMGQGAQGFSGALDAGDYTFWIQETSPNESSYSIDLVVEPAADAAPAPEAPAPAPEAPSTNVALDLNGLEPLGEGFVYEGWVIIDGAPVSTGRFDIEADGSLTFLTGSLADDVSEATTVVITIEPADDPDPGPADPKPLAGDVVDGVAELSVGHPAALGDDFSTAGGSYFVATPTTESLDDEYSGVWFIDVSSGAPAQGLELPVLPAGWVYEGWAVIDGQPVSTGRFVDPGAPDDFGGFSGPLGNPPFPGEDFIVNAPDGLTFPTDLRGQTVVISIEPADDDSPAPFAFKPLASDIPTGVDVPYVGEFGAGPALPTGVATLDIPAPPAPPAPSGDAVQITIENLQPSADAFFFTEPWVGLHNGEFDLFNDGERASAGLEALAEGGNTALLGEEFAAPGRLQTTIGNGEVQFISPGETIEGSIDIRNAAAYRYFSFASMIIPSNDAFFGNEDPLAYELFDADGNFTGPVTIDIFGSDIYDAGTEVNDGQGAAGFSLGLNGDGGTSTDDTESTVGIHPDLLANIENFQTAAGTVVTDLLTTEEPVARITITLGDSLNTQAAVGPLFDGSVVDAPAAATPPAVEGMVFAESSQGFDATLEALVGTIEANPNLEIAGIVDHAANAESVGLELDPNTVLIFGNPNIGTPLIAANPLVGIDLPIRLQVIETNGQVFVGFNDATFLTDRYGIDGLEQLNTVAGALRAITEAGTGPDQAVTETGSESFVDDSRLTTVVSDADFETTFDRLVSAIDASPANLFMVVDHAANAASVGLELNPNRELFFGNPNIGTPLIAQSPTAGFDLPLRALVWEDADGTVMVSTNSIELYTDRHGVAEADLAMVNGALNNFLTAASVTPADDGDAPEHIQFVNNEFGPRYLEVQPNVNVYSSNQSNTATEYYLNPVDGLEDTYLIQSVSTGLYLHGNGADGAFNVNVVGPVDDTAYWTITENGDGVQLFNVGLERLLQADRPGFNVDTDAAAEGASVTWQIVPVDG